MAEGAKGSIDIIYSFSVAAYVQMIKTLKYLLTLIGIIWILERYLHFKWILYIRSLFSIFDAADLVKLDLPWWSFGAVDHINNYLNGLSGQAVVLEWGSEEVIVPYLSPMDGKIHRYFPDFYMKVRQADGSTKKFIIEVKPKSQCKQPVKNPKRRTTKWFNEVKTFAINQAKWKSAREFCEDKGMEFKIFTEDHINPKYK